VFSYLELDVNFAEMVEEKIAKNGKNHLVK